MAQVQFCAEMAAAFPYEVCHPSLDNKAKVKVGVLAVSRYCQIRRFFRQGEEPIYRDHDFPVPGYLLSPSGILALQFPGGSALDTTSTPSGGGSSVIGGTAVDLVDTVGLVEITTDPDSAMTGVSLDVDVEQSITSYQATPTTYDTQYADSSDAYEMDKVEGFTIVRSVKFYVVRWKSSRTGLPFELTTNEPFHKVYRDPAPGTHARSTILQKV